ncbi:MAG: RluA family pseudouridine synthase [Chlamydiales bacterium]|nr:RluA family pseudouridine synthase [Chlamydiales bacterium]
MTKTINKNLLVDALKQEFPSSSHSTLKKWILNRRILVNGRIVTKPHFPVSPSDKISLDAKKESVAFGLEILYEDAYLVVINKPKRLLSVASNDKNEVSAHSLLKERALHQTVYPVHRLDQDTSGVMVFVYDEVAKEHLKEQFFHHTITREYLAFVEGCPIPLQGKWEHYLYETATYHSKVSDASTGKLAITYYEVLSQKKDKSLIKFTLHTGRKNQIRVQAAHEGFPVVGDKKYGSKTESHHRMFLHATKLGFTHPILNKEMSFETTYPW